MAEHYGQLQQTRGSHQQLQPRAQRVVKAATAVTAGGSLLVLSGLTLAGTVIALTIATPLLVIFSPVLVPAVITIFLLGAGKHPPGADQLESAKTKLASKAREMKDRAEQFAQQPVAGLKLLEFCFCCMKLSNCLALG
ncbi:UNVERIFIED_CONTAM: Oleosin [Sesamum latifolium]|uniref:Oleosin n=1 Tax=Sesamum latifolium TaxID=2727402 RepID=A0AAW2T9R1_9LAMI